MDAVQELPSMSSPSFGRRSRSTSAPRPAQAKAIVPDGDRRAAEPDTERAIPFPAHPEFPSVDDELREWKRARRFVIPWRQISLMASLCFGIAAFVLPDSVNSTVDYLLYALMAASFVAGISKRLKR